MGHHQSMDGDFMKDAYYASFFCERIPWAHHWICREYVLYELDGFSDTVMYKMV